MTLTQASEILNCTKEDVQKLVEEGKLEPYKALPNNVRYLVSMREVNKLKIFNHKEE